MRRTRVMLPASELRIDVPGMCQRNRHGLDGSIVFGPAVLSRAG
jgi:hypothetical protein